MILISKHGLKKSKFFLLFHQLNHIIPKLSSSHFSTVLCCLFSSPSLRICQLRSSPGLWSSSLDLPFQQLVRAGGHRSSLGTPFQPLFRASGRRCPPGMLFEQLFRSPRRRCPLGTPFEQLFQARGRRSPPGTPFEQLFQARGRRSPPGTPFEQLFRARGRRSSPSSSMVYQLDRFFDPYSVMMGSSPRFDMYRNEFGMGKALGVRSGYANKFDGKVTSYPGREGGGSIDLEMCLPPAFMTALESDDEFMNSVSLETVSAF